MNNLDEQTYLDVKKAVLNTLKLEKIELNDHQLDLLIDDLNNLIISIGGEMSVSNARYYLLEMIKNDFYPRFIQSHQDDFK